MKKTILFGVVALAMLSCNKDQTKPSPESQHKKQIFTQRTSPELERFRLAINEMNRPEYAPSKEYIQSYGDELSDERKQILFEPAKALILSTGITERDLIKETNNDVNQILNKAFKIYISQTSKK
jgi:hypothetical protein